MDDLELAIAARGGFVFRSDLLGLGWTDRAIGQARRAKMLVRLRVGTYTTPAVLASSSPEDRHLLLARSVLAKFPEGSVALSHHSAAIAHGLATWAVDLTTVHVVRLDPGSGRAESAVHHHRNIAGLGFVETPSGLLAVEPAHATFQVACAGDVRGALVVLDSALNRELAVREQLADISGRFRGWTGSRQARFVLRRADPGAQTAAESLLRQTCFEASMPVPVTQFPIVEDGEVFAWTDVAWPEHRHIGEVDGQRKYWRDLRPGEDASDVVVREKHREDRIRGLSFGVSRATAHEVRPGQSHDTGLRWSYELARSRQLHERARRHLV